MIRLSLPLAVAALKAGDFPLEFHLPIAMLSQEIPNSAETYVDPSPTSGLPRCRGYVQADNASGILSGLSPLRRVGTQRVETPWISEGLANPGRSIR